MKIDRIVEWYNDLVSKTNEQEFDLIRDEICEIDKLLDLPINSMTWERDRKRIMNHHYYY